MSHNVTNKTVTMSMSYKNKNAIKLFCNVKGWGAKKICWKVLQKQRWVNSVNILISKINKLVQWPTTTQMESQDLINIDPLNTATKIHLL